MWIKDFIIKPETMNIIGMKLENSLGHMGTGDIFLNGKPMTQALRSILDKSELRKLKSFYKANDTVGRTNYQLT